MRIVLLLFFTFSAFAHDLWLERDKGGFTLLYGHLHLSKEHGGAKVIPYEPKSVDSAICYKDGKLFAAVFSETYPVHVKQRCQLLYMHMNNGYFTKTPYGTKPKPKNEVDMAIKSWKSLESVKMLTKGPDRLLSDTLEIVVNKLPSEVGQKARLQVFYKKRPVENAVVAYGDVPRGVSDEDGRINIRVRHSGIQLIKATWKEPCGNELCDEVIHTTTLEFMLP